MYITNSLEYQDAILNNETIVDLKLADKLVVVTGAARGIGAETAKVFVQEGARVLLVDLNEEVKKLAESRFKKVRFFKPEASRDESKETYLQCAVLKTL